MQRTFTIGTRGSPLALYQARLVQHLLCQHHGHSEAMFPIKIFTTSGDQLKGHLADFGGKGLFTKELEQALINSDIDMAVHSMKDVPTAHQDGLSIAAVLKREDPRDAFISHTVPSPEHLPQGACIGTASLRRRAQLRRLRPDLNFTLLRGNVGTRLAKLKTGDCEATILACAGLIRLNQKAVITQAMATSIMLPAPAQGAIGVESRTDDTILRNFLHALNHRPTEMAVTSERSFLRALDGSCQTPIAALAVHEADHLYFRGSLFSDDGRMHIGREEKISCHTLNAANMLGAKLGRSIRREIGNRQLSELD